MNYLKIKRKRFYNSLDLSLISWELADFMAEKYGELTYVLRNKASRKKIGRKRGC